MKIAFPLGVALVVSVLLNVALLRREPSAAAPSPATAPVRLPSPATVVDDADQILLREEIRILRNRLSVAKVRLELHGNGVGFPTNDGGELTETRDFNALLELVGSFIEAREAEVRDEQGRLVRQFKQVLPPQNQDAALRAVEDYLGLDGSERLSFHESAQSAVGAYHRLLEMFNREHLAALKAGENDEFFEDGARRQQEVMDRMSRRQEEWMSVQVRPIRDFLDRRDGVRSALLSDNLPTLLFLLGTPDER
jgi:hypothetical protein